MSSVSYNNHSVQFQLQSGRFCGSFLVKYYSNSCFMIPGKSCNAILKVKLLVEVLMVIDRDMDGLIVKELSIHQKATKKKNE